MNRTERYNTIIKTPKKLWAMAAGLIAALEAVDAEDIAWYVANGHDAGDLAAMQTALAAFQPGLAALVEDATMRKVLGIPEPTDGQ